MDVIDIVRMDNCSLVWRLSGHSKVIGIGLTPSMTKQIRRSSRAEQQSYTHRNWSPPSGKLVPEAEGLPPRRLEMSHKENLDPCMPPMLRNKNLAIFPENAVRICTCLYCLGAIPRVQKTVPKGPRRWTGHGVQPIPRDWNASSWLHQHPPDLTASLSKIWNLYYRRPKTPC